MKQIPALRPGDFELNDECKREGVDPAAFMRIIEALHRRETHQDGLYVTGRAATYASAEARRKDLKFKRAMERA